MTGYRDRGRRPKAESSRSAGSIAGNGVPRLWDRRGPTAPRQQKKEMARIAPWKGARGRAYGGVKGGAGWAKGRGRGAVALKAAGSPSLVLFPGRGRGGSRSRWAWMAAAGTDTTNWTWGPRSQGGWPGGDADGLARGGAGWRVGEPGGGLRQTTDHSGKAMWMTSGRLWRSRRGNPVRASAAAPGGAALPYGWYKQPPSSWCGVADGGAGVAALGCALRGGRGPISARRDCGTGARAILGGRAGVRMPGKAGCSSGGCRVRPLLGPGVLSLMRWCSRAVAALLARVPWLVRRRFCAGYAGLCRGWRVMRGGDVGTVWPGVRERRWEVLTRPPRGAGGGWGLLLGVGSPRMVVFAARVRGGDRGAAGATSP